MARKATIIHTECGTRLKILLEEYDMTQAKLSDIANVSRVFINRIIRGKANMTEAVAENLVKAFPQENPTTLKEWLLCRRQTRQNLKQVCHTDYEKGYYEGLSKAIDVIKELIGEEVHC